MSVYNSAVSGYIQAHEKGLVEGLVGYSRRNWLLYQNVIVGMNLTVCYGKQQDILNSLPITEHRPGAYEHANNSGRRDGLMFMTDTFPL